MVTGCKHLIQPSRSDLTEVNSFSQGSYELHIFLQMMDPQIALQYDTTVIASGENAETNGTATVYFLETYFQQACRTRSNADGSCKLWRDKWVSSQYASPLLQVQSWQDMVLDGKGYYEKIPVALADFTDRNTGEQCFLIQMSGIALDWSDLCDVHMDRLFGEDRLAALTSANISLLYNTETLLLDAAIIQYEQDGVWAKAVITITPTVLNPTPPGAIETVEKDLLNEEWNILVNGA